MDPSYKKRHRIPASCLVCRKRKSKCDRQRPVCGTCKKKLIAHLCVFEDDSLAPLPLQHGYVGPPMALDARSTPQLAHMPPHMVPVPHAPHAPPYAFAPHPGAPPLPAGSHMLGHVYPQAGPWSPPVAIHYHDSLQPQDPHAKPGAQSLPRLHRRLLPPPVQLPMHTHLPLAPPRPPPSHPSSVFSYYQPHDKAAARNGLNGSQDSPFLPGKGPAALLVKDKVPVSAASSISTASMSLGLSTSSAGSVAMAPPTTERADPGSATASEYTGKTPTYSVPASETDRDTLSPQKRTLAQQKDEDRKKRYVPVSMGANVLQIEVNDIMESFSDASHALLVEGHYWQLQGFVSYIGLTKNDPYIKLIRNFTFDLFRTEQFSQFVRKKQKKKSSTAGGTSAASSASSTEHGGNGFGGSTRSDPYSKAGDDTNESSDWESDPLNDDALIVTKINADREKEEPSLFGHSQGGFSTLPGIQSLHSLYTSKESYYTFVNSCVALILPTKRGIHEAISRFFQFVHPFVSIFHEQSFMSDLKSILPDSFPGDEYYESINIRNEAQLNLFGVLLLVIRLGYMTLIPNNEAPLKYTKEEQRLIKDVTRFKSDHYISVVNLCILEEKVQTKSDFKIVQSLCLLYFYRSVAPNDCHGLGGSDSQLLFGSIVNHAISIGLHRDPTRYNTIPSISKKPSDVNTWRLLWAFIVRADAMSAMYCGNPLKIPNIEISDVERPHFETYSEQVLNLNSQLDKVHCLYRRIINRTTNLQSKPKVIDILREASQLENIFLEIFGEDFFRDYICSPAHQQLEPHEPYDRLKHEESFLKVSRFLAFINIRANLSCLYYLVALHYEHKLDDDPSAGITAGIELFKIFIRSVVQLIYIMSYALDNSHELFGKSYDFILTSLIERAMIKTHNFTTSFFIRLVNYKRTLALQGLLPSSKPEEDHDARVEVVDSLFTIALIEAELFVGNFRTLSKTYINSYRLYVMAYFALKQCMENPEYLLAGFTQKKLPFYHDGTNLLQFFSVAELQSLCKLCEEFRLAKVESIRRQKNHQKATGQPADTDAAETKRPDFERASVATSVSEVEPVSSTLDDSFEAHMDSTFDATLANRAMYANENTVTTYGMLQEKHMTGEYQKEVFDEQNMIGNEELLKLFEIYGDVTV